MTPTLPMGGETSQESCSDVGYIIWDCNVLYLLKWSIISGTKLMVTLCRKGALSAAGLITTGAVFNRSCDRPSREYTYPAPPSQTKVSGAGWRLIISLLLCSAFSLRGGSQPVWPAADGDVGAAHHLHHALLSLLHREGGPGVRESRHLQTGPAGLGRSPGAGSLLCHPLPRCLREDRHENVNLRCSPSGDPH